MKVKSESEVAQSCLTLRETSPGCSLEGLMLRLKLQYFGHLMQRVDSLEKTLMLGGVKVKVFQSCPTLCDSKDYTGHGILQARLLERVAVSFSRGFPNSGIKPRSPALHADALPAEPPGKPL